MANEERYEALPSSKEDLAGRLEAKGLSAATIRQIVGAARPALVLRTTPAEDASIPIGASKMGGLPDLPADMAWPVRPAYERAGDLAKRLSDDAAELYADAGTPPPWMSEADGKALVETRKRIKAEAWAGTRDIMAAAGVKVDPELEHAYAPDPEAIKSDAAARLAMAEAVQRPFPLTFIGQVDLAALSRQDGFDPALPDSGRLLLFYDLWILPASFEPRARAGLRVIYDKTPAAGLRRSEAPPDFRAIAALERSMLKPATIAARGVVTTIPTYDASWDALGVTDKKDGDRYAEWLYTLGWPTAPGGGNHQLGGWPRAFQTGMQSMSQLASNGVDAGTSEAWRSAEAKRLRVDAKEWRLVLQIGVDQAINQTLPGALYLLMRQQDLENRRFDKAWIVYEQD